MGAMNDFDRFELVQRITQLEGELAAIRFPASGSLYLCDSLVKGEKRIELSSDVDPSRQFCIGPSCERQWNTSTEGRIMSSAPEFDRGPWPNVYSFGIALVEREISRKEKGKASPRSGCPFVSIEEELSILRMTKEVMSMLGTGTIIDRFSQPVLWHTDLHMGNIFVSVQDPTEVVSIIDWQSTSVSPLFLQVRFPEFLSVDSDFVLDAPMPELPEDYTTMDPVDKQIAEFKTRQAKMAKAYEVSTSVHNPQAYKALFMPSFLKDLFTRSGEVAQEGIIPLRASLIQLAEAWDDIGFKSQCSFSFDGEDIQQHELQFKRYRNFHSIQEIARKLLDTDSEGWVSPQLDFDSIMQQNKELLNEVMRRSSEFNTSPENVRRIWPF